MIDTNPLNYKEVKYLYRPKGRLRPVGRRKELMNCTGPGTEEGTTCTNTARKNTGLCSNHARQLSRNPDRPLRPIRPRKSMYEGKTCAEETCDKVPTVQGYCGTHYSQWRDYGQTYPVGQQGVRKEERQVTYSETKKCDYCRATKHWRSFVMGVEDYKSECRDCYRKRLFKPEPESKKKPYTFDDLLKFIDKQTERNAK